MPEPVIAPENVSVIVLLLIAGGWYAAVRGAVDALPLRWRSIGQIFPIAALVVVSAARGQADIAVAAVFSSSVALLTLVLGLVAISGLNPVDDDVAPALPMRNTLWGLLLPAAVLLFLIGLRSHFSILHAIIIAAEGSVILWVGLRDMTCVRSRIAFGRFAQLLLCVALASVMAWAAVSVSHSVRGQYNTLPARTVTTLMLVPGMILPSIGLGVAQARLGQLDEAISSLVASVHWNLLALLPIAILLDWFRHRHDDPAWTGLLFPVSIWRIDSVMLLIVSLLLLPMSIGRWRMGKLEGVALIALYVTYLSLTATQSPQ